MDGLVQSIRSRARRPWFLGIVGLTVAVVGFLLVSSRGGPAALELVTVDADGGVHDRVSVKAGAGQTVASSDRGGVTRIPLALSVRNSGGEPVRPDRLELSLPKHLRISTSSGGVLRGRSVPGNPLVRYRLPGPFPVIEPGSAPTPIAPGDDLWLELTTSPVYCVVLADSVPEFLLAPESRSALSHIQIFYSFEGGELQRRQTGLLSVTLDPALLERDSVETPPTFPTELQNTDMPLPPMGALSYVGSTKSDCGAPEQPIQLFSTLWETPEGGRFFVIDYGGVARKYLFDLNRDDVIELEMWDAQGKGSFQASRKAQLPIPPYLMPGGEDPEHHDANVFANVPRDSLGNYDRFRQTIAGGSNAVRSRRDPSRHRHRPLASSGDRDQTTSSPDRSTARPPIGRPSDTPGTTGPAREPARRAEPTEPAAPPAAAPEPPAIRQPTRPREPTRQREPTRSPEPVTPRRRTQPLDPPPIPQPPRREAPPERPAAEPQRERREERDEPRLLGVPVDSVSVSPTSDRPEPDAEPEAEPDAEPDDAPEAEPDDAPEDEPDDAPEAEPDDAPEAEPDDAPEAEPDDAPEAEPDDAPEAEPDGEPDRERRRP